MCAKTAWREMLRKSFDPKDWFEQRDWEPDSEDGGSIMWVYRKLNDEFVVGFYAPDGAWHEEAVHYAESGAAAERVHWLNGGS